MKKQCNTFYKISLVLQVFIRRISYFEFLHSSPLVFLDFFQNQFSHIMLPKIGADVGNILVLWVHQIGQNSMIDSIGFTALYDWLLVLKLNFRRIDLELAHTVLERGVIIAFSGYSDHWLVEILGEFLYFLMGVTIRVNWNENWLDVEKFCIRWLSDLF